MSRHNQGLQPSFQDDCDEKQEFSGGVISYQRNAAPTFLMWHDLNTNLSIHRAALSLSRVVHANDPQEVVEAAAKAHTILCENLDDPNEYNEADVLEYRWKTVLAEIDEESPLRVAIEFLRTPVKANEGNPNGRGHTHEESFLFDLDFHRLASILS